MLKWFRLVTSFFHKVNVVLIGHEGFKGWVIMFRNWSSHKASTRYITFGNVGTAQFYFYISGNVPGLFVVMLKNEASCFENIVLL